LAIIIVTHGVPVPMWRISQFTRLWRSGEVFRATRQDYHRGLCFGAPSLRQSASTNRAFQ